ncbi:MAG: amidohydrolase family protein [Gammaproteobacteria bacterium]|jgi:imidazolonepropionase-like amidohydrolase|nr:amidohydrolase family protein [Gammaproteobacteria bacterium]
MTTNNQKNNFVIVFLIFFSCFVHAENRKLLIEDVVLIDGTGRPAIEHASVMVSGERISEIRRGKFSGAERKKAQTINAKGKYLIPGLMDIHIHLIGGVKVSKDGLREASIDMQKGTRALNGYLYSGVTSVYDSGNIPEFIFALRNQERAGRIQSPRIFATGGIVTYPGSHGSGAGATLVDDWPEAKSSLEEHLKYQPDIVKLTLEERGWGARPLIPLLPLPLMEHIIGYYNDKGIRATAHTASEFRAKQAIFAGIDSLSHPVITGPISESFPGFMAAKKIPMATTLTIGENYSRLAEHPEYLDQALYQAVLTKDEIKKLKNETSAEYRERTWTWWMKIMTPIAQENLRKLNAGGAVIALGTDQSSGPAVHREMELLVAAGIPTSDVLKIATLNAARFLGMEDELGSISEGKLADMVLLDADPIANIDNAKKINVVIKNGVIVERDKMKIPANQ